MRLALVAGGYAEPVTEREHAIGKPPGDGLKLDEIDRLPAARIAYRSILLVALLVVVGLAFQALASLVLATLITVIVAIPLAACASRAERAGLPRAVGALGGLLVGVGVVAAIFAVVIPRFVEQAGALIDDIPETVAALQNSVRDLTGGTAQGTPPSADELQEYLRRLLDDPQALVAPVATISLSVLGAVTTSVLVLLTAFYIAVNPGPLIDGALRLFPPHRRPWARSVLDRLRAAWIGWMQGVGVDMVISGVLLYIGLTIIGLPFAIVFALLSALLVLIPYYGSIIGAVPTVLFALAESPSLALLTLVVYVLVQQIEGNVIIPLVMANRVNLHPAPIAIGVLVIGQLFGFAGLFVAVPVLSAVIILVDELWVRPMEAGIAPGQLPEPPPAPRRLRRLWRRGDASTAPQERDPLVDQPPADGPPAPPPVAAAYDERDADGR
jgi:predicted PurR-regulated permease PerM